MKSYISAKVELGESPIHGKALFVKEKIPKGELVIDFSKGPGTYLNTEEAEALFNKGYDYMIQVDDDRFFAATNKEELEDVDFVNHSCDPTCGIQGSLRLIARRDIEPGEEISFDYAMSESSDFEMECHCGSAHCRGKITGEDWKRNDLQKKYQGYFSDYLQKKIT